MEGKRFLKEYSKDFEEMFPNTDEDEMIKFFGTEVTVVGDSDEAGCVLIEEDEGDFLWAIEWFEDEK